MMRAPGFLFKHPNVDLAFPEREDRPWRKRALRDHLKAASEAAGVPYGRAAPGGGPATTSWGVRNGGSAHEDGKTGDDSPQSKN